jgi:hypothetical protein
MINADGKQPTVAVPALRAPFFILHFAFCILHFAIALSARRERRG